jgi:eukaryotic-like serine/threonine-protein kinase
MALASGTKLGSYEILAAIGAGGMGEVYRARDAKLGRDVAIKVLPASFARDAERMARFEREARLLASLDHPNVASIYGVEDSGETLALVMQLAEGPTLADRIGQGPIPVDEALRIARQIADALEYAHERGVVHRDLKPANIKISRDDSVKILDFGLAKAVQGEASEAEIANSPTLTHMATQAGILLGTAAYMSPEQAKAKPVDRRADIWAFGCVLYEMLTGTMAFHGETVTDTLAAVIRGEPDWSALPANTPARVRVLLQRCLQKDPKQRLRDIGEARISLDEVLSGAPEVSSSAGVSPANFSFWRRVLPWAVACVAVLAAIAVTFSYVGRTPAAPIQLVRFEIPVPQKLTLLSPAEFDLSPDGRQLAFDATGADGTSSIYIRPLDSLQARRLPGTESTDWPFWSPDSQHIAFFTGEKLRAIDVSSGTIETICDTVKEGGGSWSRNGLIVFGQPDGGVMKVSADGGSPIPVTSVDSSRGEVGHMFPSFLPDGRHFIYLRVSLNPSIWGIYVGSVDAVPGEQDSQRLLATNYDAEYVPSLDPNIGHLAFLTSDGTLMAQAFDARRLKLMGKAVPLAQGIGSFSNIFGFFSASAAGALVYRGGAGGLYRLTWFDRQGEVQGTVGEPIDSAPPALSPDGTEAVASRSDDQGGNALWLLNFSRATSTRFTFGSRAAAAIWSPDERRIVFVSGADRVYEKAADGATNEELLLKASGFPSPTDVSRDGRFLLYNAFAPKTDWDIWALPLRGGGKPFPFLQTQFAEIDGHFSPDGRWVAYASDESGRSDVYVRPFSADASANADGGGVKWQVSYEGGQWPIWSNDGKELYYLTLDWKVMEVDVTTNPTFQAGSPKFLFQAPQQAGNAAGNVGSYTADGKRFLFSVPIEQGGQAPFNVVLNWQAALKQ